MDVSNLYPTPTATPTPTESPLEESVSSKTVHLMSALPSNSTANTATQQAGSSKPPVRTRPRNDSVMSTGSNGRSGPSGQGNLSKPATFRSSRNQRDSQPPKRSIPMTKQLNSIQRSSVSSENTPSPAASDWHILIRSDSGASFTQVK